MNTRLLSRRDVADLLDPGTCRVAVEEAFRQHGAGEAPPPQVFAVPVEGGGFHVKAGTLRGVRRYFAAKVNGNFSGNERLGLPRIQGVIVLCDAEDGSVLAVMDSSEITKLRTAAATAVAAAQLARAGSKTVTIVGCGVQGRAQLRALARVLPLERAFAFDENRERAARFEESFSLKGQEEEPGGAGGRLAVRVAVRAAESLCEALAESDVVVTCTPSKKPLLFSSSPLRPGTFVAAVGADAEDKQELDVGLLASAKVVTDVTAQCVAFGDLHHAIRAGLISASDVHAELGEIVAGKKPGRTSQDEVIVFDSTGMALQDVAAAAAAFERAEAERIGDLVSLSR
ncbi:MAG TPA: ornithine cyclodeaminase family protein [Thermoanaerobaculia bacterium]|nr:ornithine cyclodeaminase family protein [Thermoanaerobaculia bacterium]